MTEENDIEVKLKVEEKPKLEWQENISKESMTWGEAMGYAKSLGDGWRLPTIEELKEAYDNKLEGFAHYNYWSSSINACNIYSACSVNLSNGSMIVTRKDINLLVRCVREVK